MIEQPAYLSRFVSLRWLRQLGSKLELFDRFQGRINSSLGDVDESWQGSGNVFGFDKDRSHVILDVPLHGEALDLHECVRNDIAGRVSNLLFDASRGIA